MTDYNLNKSSTPYTPSEETTDYYSQYNLFKARASAISFGSTTEENLFNKYVEEIIREKLENETQ